MADLRPARDVTAHRFYVPRHRIAASRVEFASDQAHQISRVLRLRVGDEVVVFDGSGTELIVCLTGVGRETTGQIKESRQNEAEPVLHLTLYQGLLKGAKLETVLQKCTEVGVSRFVPIRTTRAVGGQPSGARLVRFDAVVREAAEQSGRGTVPEVLPPQSFTGALECAVAAGAAFLAWEDERAHDIWGIMSLAGVNEASLFIGPEGGFTAQEADMARRAGVEVISLGPRILRAETAAIVGAALVLARAGGMAPSRA